MKCYFVTYNSSVLRVRDTTIHKVSTNGGWVSFFFNPKLQILVPFSASKCMDELESAKKQSDAQFQTSNYSPV